MRGYPAILFSVFFTLISCFASASPKQDPFLFLDGTALANLVTPWILENSSPGTRLVLRRFKRPRNTLRLGLPFRGEDHPHVGTLTNWIMEQADRSIAPHMLFKKAVEIERGNVFLSFVLIWDFLRKDWTKGKERNSFPHIKKLMDITGEHSGFTQNDFLVPVVNGKTGNLKFTFGDGITTKKITIARGDNFSAWYHFFGTGLNSFYQTVRKRNPIPGHWETTALIFLEEWVLYNDFIDPEKRRINDLQGSLFGQALAYYLKEYRTSAEFSRNPQAENTLYLYAAPDRFSPQWQLQSGQHPRDQGTTLKTARYHPDSKDKTLLKGLEHRNHATRYFALMAIIARKTSESSLAMLRTAIQNSDPAIAFTAGEAWFNRSREFKINDVHVFDHFVYSPHTGTREKGARLLHGFLNRLVYGQGNTELHMAMIAKLSKKVEHLVTDTDKHVRRMASECIRKFPNDNIHTYRLVKTALQSHDHLVLLEASQSIGKTGTESNKLELITQVLNLGAPSLGMRLLRPIEQWDIVRTRRQAVRHIAGIPGCSENKKQLIIRMLSDSDNQIRKTAKVEWNKHFPGVKPPRCSLVGGILGTIQFQ